MLWAHRSNRALPLLQYQCRYFPRKNKKNQDLEDLSAEDIQKRGGRQIYKDQLMNKLSGYRMKPTDQEQLDYASVRSKKELDMLKM